MNMNEKEKIENYKAEMLRKLVLEHTEKCNGDCNLSTYLIYETFYKPFLGEKRAKKHFKDFI